MLSDIHNQEWICSHPTHNEMAINIVYKTKPFTDVL